MWSPFAPLGRGVVGGVTQGSAPLHHWAFAVRRFAARTGAGCMSGGCVPKGTTADFRCQSPAATTLIQDVTRSQNPSIADDLKLMVQLGVLEEAEEGVGGLDEPDGSLSGLEGPVEADEGPEAGAIDEPQGAGVDFNALMLVAKGGVDGELDRWGRGGGKFGKSRDPEDGTKGFGFHEGLPLGVEEEGTVEPPGRAVTEATE